MRIAFYAPLKPADHERPSGDRQMARLFCVALARAGCTVETASRFSSFDAGDKARQERLAGLGGRLAARLIRGYRRRPPGERPRAWFTYHLYHKAPDWLGPPVSRALAIPYVVAEASHAPKRDTGPWAAGSAAAARAITAADMIFNLNPADAPCVRRLLPDPGRLVPLAPFIDAAAWDPGRGRQRLREACRARMGIPANLTLLLAVAMMRPGDKLASYLCLAEALGALAERSWRLLVAGDGSARPHVEAAMAPLGRRVVFLGRCDEEALRPIYAAADLYVWPAIGEAYGVAFLEAQAAGLPVVAGRSGGVPAVVADNEAGLLVPAGDTAAFAAAVARLLDNPVLRRSMAEAARGRVRRHHDLAGAASALGAQLATLTAKGPP